MIRKELTCGHRKKICRESFFEMGSKIIEKVWVVERKSFKSKKLARTGRSGK